MLVISGMACATRKRARSFQILSSVTTLAAEFAMFISERKTRFVVVVEPGYAPLLWRMASLTIRPKRPGVHILKFVARDTIAGEIYEPLITMAPAATNCAMLPIEWKGRCAMIKVEHPPRGESMTLLTLLAQLPLMWIRVAMAATALRRRIPIFHRCAVACFTTYGTMPSGQREVSPVVIET